MKKIDKDTKEIIDSFVSEGYERLEDAESKIPYLESDESAEIVNTVFRLFHSIKGSAGYLNFQNIKSVTHEAETLLDLYRKGNRKPDPKEIDLLYQTLDVLHQMIEMVEKELSDEGFEKDAEIVVNSIAESIANIRDSREKRGDF